MAKKILFVVEGERAETKMLISMFERALSLSSEQYDVCKYKTNIHNLYKKMKELGYDSFLSFLYSEHKEIFPKDMFTPETAFASVYLFFDLDPQDSLFSIEETKELATYFNDETQNGKLYISYPMVESVFDFASYRQGNYNKRTYKINMLSNYYKSSARLNSFLSIKYKTKSFRKIRNGDIYSICVLNMKKYAFLCNETFNIEWKTQYSPIKCFLSEVPFIKRGLVSILSCGVLLIPDYSVVLLEAVKKLQKSSKSK